MSNKKIHLTESQLEYCIKKVNEEGIHIDQKDKEKFKFALNYFKIFDGSMFDELVEKQNK
jgi:hypothetical protein